MAGSYLGHGAKYWADRYFECQNQTRLSDDSSDFSWREKYIALEKECSSYQATLADMRTEIEYLRSQRAETFDPDPELQRKAEKWRLGYLRLYSTLKEKEIQCDAPSAEKQNAECQLQAALQEKDLYRGKTAEQWAELYFSEQYNAEKINSALQTKDSEIQTLKTAVNNCQKSNEIDGHDAIYWHHKYISLKDGSFNRRLFFVSVIAFLAFSLGMYSAGVVEHSSDNKGASSQSVAVSYSESLSPKVQPQTGILYSSSSETNSVPFKVIASSKVNYYILLCQGNKIIKSYYIRAGEILSVKVPSGGYTIYFAYAPSTSTWFGTESLWGTHTSYYRFSKTFPFSEGYTYGQLFDLSGPNSYDVETLSKADWDNLY